MTPDDYQHTTEKDILTRLTDGATFDHLYLKDAVLSGLQAHDLTFKDCVFENVDLTAVNWPGLRCISVKFKNCELHDADLEDASFKDCGFFDPNAPPEPRGSHAIYPPGGCKFVRANLHGASFTNCDLSFCVFEGANMFHAAIENSKATSAKFARASFNRNTKLLNSVLHYADLRGANLTKCELSGTDFRWANLDEVDFSEAVLVGSNLSAASTRCARFERADLRGAAIGTFDIRTMDLHGAKISESQMRLLLENCGLVIFPDGR